MGHANVGVTSRPVLTSYCREGKTSYAQRHQQDVTTDHLQDLGRRRCSDRPPLDVQSWRACRLLEAGFPAETAQRLAADRRFDLHALLDLVDRGCPPLLAVRIVAPLDTDLAP